MKKTKLLTSLAALALIVGLGACEAGDININIEGGVNIGGDSTTDTTSDDDGKTPEDPSGNPGEGDDDDDDEGKNPDDDPSGNPDPTPEPGEGGGSTEITSLSNYTLSIGIEYANELVEVPEYATAYIQGSWDSWTQWLALTPKEGRYEYTFSSIDIDTYEYQLVLAYKDEEPGWTYRITQDGANASFTVKEEDGDDYKNEVTVTSSKALTEIIPDPNAAISDVTLTIDITYNGVSQGVLDYGTLWIQGGWDSWASWVACSAVDGKYVATFDSLAPIEYEFIGVIYYTGEDLPDSSTLWDYKVNGSANAKFTVDSNAVSTTLVATKALADILPEKGEEETPSEPVAYAIVGDFVDSSWNESPATDSIYYIPAETTEYTATVTIADQGSNDWDASFRVVEYGTWTTAVGYTHLDSASTGAWQGSKDNNIAVNWGETYELVITLGDNPSILVTQVIEQEEEETYLFGFNVNGTMYYIDGKTATNYNYEGTYTTDVNSAVRVSVEDSETAGEYYLSFVLNGATYWITIIDNSGHINLSYATEAAPLYWNATYNCWGDDTLSYFLCQNATYGCLYCSAISQYINSSPIAGLYTEDGEAYTTGLVGYELPAPTKITVSGKESLYIGSTTQLSVTVEPANAIKDVTWSTSNESYATVSDSGLVTGVGEGDVTITATSVKNTNVSGSINIAVSEAPTGLTEVKLGTYDFSTKTKDFCSSNGGTSVVTASQLKNTLDTYWTSEDNYDNPLDSINSTNYIYQYYTSSSFHANEYNLLKTGTGSANGTMDLTMVDTITKVEIDQQSWSATENCTITVNDVSFASTTAGTQETLTFDIDETTNLSMTFAKRTNIFSITLYGYVA